MARRAIRGLYAITPDTPDTDVLLAKVRQVLAGGARVLQYRNKSPSAALKREQASALLALCREHRVPLIINDDVALACTIDADGAHLGATDGDLVEARKQLGPSKLLGATCYQQIALAHTAKRAGADHVAFGGFFRSSTKPSSAARTPLTLIAEAKAQVDVPIVAIGGITHDNALELIGSGADAIAVISALFDAPDVAASAQRFVALWPSANPAAQPQAGQPT